MNSCPWFSCFQKYSVHAQVYTCVLRLCSVASSCPALCNSLDCSTPGSSVLGIFQARTLDWAPIPYFRDLPTQVSNLCLLHLRLCRRILYLLSHIRVGLYVYLCPLASVSLEGGVYSSGHVWMQELDCEES